MKGKGRVNHGQIFFFWGGGDFCLTNAQISTFIYITLFKNIGYTCIAIRHQTTRILIRPLVLKFLDPPLFWMITLKPSPCLKAAVELLRSLLPQSWPFTCNVRMWHYIKISNHQCKWENGFFMCTCFRFTHIP